MRICRFLAFAAVGTLSVKGAVLTHWYTFNGNVNDQVGSANGTLFGGAIAFLCSYEGYVTGAGAEGVGRATAKAVVIGCVSVLILDALIAVLLAPYLQS